MKTYAKKLTKKEMAKKASQFWLIVITTLTLPVFGFLSTDFVQSEEYTTSEVKVARKATQPATKEVKQVSQINKTVEQQIRDIAKENNFKWTDYLVRLAFCESSLNPRALGDNGNSRGLFQIHKGYHPEVTDDKAYDIRFSTEWTINKINQGKQHLWSCDKIAKRK